MRDSIVFGVGVTGACIGLSIIFKGVYSMGFGVNKIQK
jgi:hypothetical protein